MIEETKRKKSKLPVTIIVILAILISFLVYAETQTGIVSGAFDKSQMRLVETGIKFDYGTGSGAIFSKGTDGFLCVTRDSATYYDFKGHAVWSQTFTMNSPYIIKDDNNWAILEPGGRQVYVCNNEQVLYTVSRDDVILSASINKLSCLALILEVDDNYRIELFNAKGVNTLERRSELPGVYPFCVDLADDGYTFAVGYLDTNKTSLQSRVLFLYTESGAKLYGKDEKTPFKAIERQNSLISKISYGKDNNLAVLSDNELFITDSKGEQFFSYAFQNQLKSSSVGDNIIGLVNGEPFPSTQGYITPGYSEWYTFEGAKVGGFLDYDIELVEVYDKAIVLKDNLNYYCIDLKGRLLWTFGAAQDVLSIIPIDRKRAIVCKTGFAEVYTYKTTQPQNGRTQDENAINGGQK